MNKEIKIPKIIHYCWIGNKDIPRKDKENIETWKRLCPDYKFMFWNEKNYDLNKNLYMKQAYEQKKWGFVPDYLRLDVVYQYGGVYLDTDVQMCKNIDELLKNEAFAGFENSSSVNFGSGFGAVPHNTIIKKMLENYEKLEFIRSDGSLNLVASPEYQTAVLKDNGLRLNGKFQKLNEITIYPSEILSPLDFETGKLKKTAKTYCIHWYNASWHDDLDKKKMKRVRKINCIFGKKIGYLINQMINLIVLIKEEGIKETLKKIEKKIKNNK